MQKLIKEMMALGVINESEEQTVGKVKLNFLDPQALLKQAADVADKKKKESVTAPAKKSFLVSSS